MPYLTDLADACRRSGLKVVETPGWKTRGHGPMSSVSTVVVHHTATPASAPGDYPTLGIVRDGRPGLPGPLSQLGLGRDGTVYIIAAGVAYHAGETWTTSQNNWHAIGIEAEHDGLTPWTSQQYDAYVRLCRALCDHYGLDENNVQGHKEVAKPAGRKVDPTFDMDAFRNTIAAQGEDMPYLDWPQADRDALLRDIRKTLHGGDQSRFQRLRDSLRNLAKSERQRDAQLADKLEQLAADDA